MENQPMQFNASADTDTMYYLNSTTTNSGNGYIDESSSRRSDDEYLKSLPPGVHFRPTDGELIVEYLIKKIKNEKLPPNRINEVNIYKFNPETLEDEYKLEGEKDMYFFTPRDRKYKKGERPTRAAGGGFWKAIGADKTIEHNGQAVGCKKALVFFKGKSPDGKTSWIMHEYKVNILPPRQRINEDDMKLDDWVLCRIYNNVRNPKREDTHVQIPETNNNVEQQNEPTAEGSSINVAPEDSWAFNEIESRAMPNSYPDMDDFNYDFPYDYANCPDDGSDFQSIPFNLDTGTYITNPAPISVMPSNTFVGGYDYGQCSVPNLQEPIRRHQDVFGLPTMDTNGFPDFTHCPVLTGQHQENKYGVPAMDTNKVQYFFVPVRHGPFPTRQQEDNNIGISEIDNSGFLDSVVEMATNPERFRSSRC